MEIVALTNNLDHIGNNRDRSFSRVYFGNEFCNYLLPTDRDISLLQNLKKKRKIEFGIVLPYINQLKIKQSVSLLRRIDKELPGSEIIVNDWGALNLIKNEFPGLTIVLGRLFSRQRRGFFLKGAAGKNTLIDAVNVGDREKEYLKSSVLQNDYLMGFFRELGIRRIGIDNLRQGIIPDNKYNMDVDLYYPLVYITTSNRCLTASLHRKDPVSSRIARCDNVCMRVPRRTMEILGVKVYLVGNTQFYFNDKLGAGDTSSVSRLVETIF